MKGITLREGDEVVGLDVAHANSVDEVLVVTENGYGKRTPVNDYRLSNRGGKGIKTATITERNGNVVCITTVTGEEDLMIVTNLECHYSTRCCRYFSKWSCSTRCSLNSLR